MIRTKILPERLQTAEAAIVPELQRAIAETGGEIAVVLHSSAYADAAADPEAVTDLTQFGSFEGIDGHAELVDGRWATPGQTPIEATLSQPRRRRARRQDRRHAVAREPPRRQPARRRRDHRHLARRPGRRLLAGRPAGARRQEKGGRFTTPRAAGRRRGGPRRPGRSPSRSTRSGAPSPTSTASGRSRSTPSRPNVGGLLGRVNAALPGTNQASISTKLPAILASVDRSVLVAQAGILLLLVQFGVLAAYAVILVAALLLERRRTRDRAAPLARRRHRPPRADGLRRGADRHRARRDRRAVAGDAARPGGPPQPGDGGRGPDRAAARTRRRSRRRSSAASSPSWR